MVKLSLLKDRLLLVQATYTRTLICSVMSLILLSGCATTSERRAFDGALGQRQLTLAENIAVDAGTKNNYPTELLWALEAGALLRHSAKYAQSTAVFDGTEDLIKQEEQKNGLSSGLSLTASILVNDNVTSYPPRVYDRVMVNTYKALNFWAVGDFENARVEWNRTDDRQRRAAEYFSKEIAKQKEQLSIASSDVGRSLGKSMEALNSSGVDVNQWVPYSDYINPGSLYLHGLYFLLNGESSSDFDRARVSLTRAYSMTRNKQIAADLQLVKNGRSQANNVWVIFENGMAARKEEMRIDLPIFVVSDKLSYVGFALPVLKTGYPAHDHLRVNNQQKTVSFAVMDKIIKGEFKTEFTTILIKELTRAIAKTAAQKSLLDSDDKTTRLIGQVFAAAQAVTTQADLRSWHTLPYDFQVARVSWPKSGRLTLTTSDGNAIDVNLPSTPQPTIVYVRIITAGATPQVEILTSKNAL